MSKVKCYGVQIYKDGKVETLKQEFDFLFDKEVTAEDIRNLFYKLDKETGYIVRHFSCQYG